MNVYRNITDLIGNTPMLELAALAKEKNFMQTLWRSWKDLTPEAVSKTV